MRGSLRAHDLVRMHERTSETMTTRERWITWGLVVLSAILAAIAAGRPIVIPPPPINLPDGQPQPAPPPSEPKPNPLGAIARIGRANVGCSATIIGPRRSDNRYWALSAAHCCQAVGERWNARLRDGRTVGLQVVNIDRKADVAWMLTDSSDTNFVLPYALLAEHTPEKNAKVWHAGFGIDQPGNVESGRLVNNQETTDGQWEYWLSVSSGDSGGAIVDDATGSVLGPVCCTTAPGHPARVWAASPAACRKQQRVNLSLDEWEPFPIPVHKPIMDERK